MGKKGKETKAQILDAAIKLFSKKGFSKTSVSELLNETNLTKGGLYWHFENKDAIGLAVIQAIKETWLPHILYGVEDERDIKEKILKIVDNRINMGKSDESASSLFIMLTTEAFQLEGGFKKELIILFNKWRDAIAKIIEEGIRKRLIRKGVDTQAMAATIIGTIEGALLISQLNKKALDYKMVSDSIKRLVNGLFE